jgi:hypothetical protein
MKLLPLGIALALAGCVKQGQVRDERPAPALRDLCTDARFKSVCTPVQMPGASQVDIDILPMRVDTNMLMPASSQLFS